MGATAATSSWAEPKVSHKPRLRASAARRCTRVPSRRDLPCLLPHYYGLASRSWLLIPASCRAQLEEYLYSEKDPFAGSFLFGILAIIIAGSFILAMLAPVILF